MERLDITDTDLDLTSAMLVERRFQARLALMEALAWDTDNHGPYGINFWVVKTPEGEFNG